MLLGVPILKHFRVFFFQYLASFKVDGHTSVLFLCFLPARMISVTSCQLPYLTTLQKWGQPLKESWYSSWWVANMKMSKLLSLKMHPFEAIYLLAVSSPIKSIWSFPSSSSGTLPDNTNDGGFCCHAGLVLFEGSTGRNRMGSLVPFPLLPPFPGFGWNSKITIQYYKYSKTSMAWTPLEP